MDFSSKRNKILLGVIALCVVVVLAVIIDKSRNSSNSHQAKEEVEVAAPAYLYGVCIDSLEVKEHTIESGDVLSSILDPYGVTMGRIFEIEQAAKDTFDFRSIRIGNHYTTISERIDSVTQKLNYFVYQENKIDYVVVDLRDSAAVVYKGAKKVEQKRMKKSFVIESSLWNAMIAEGVPAGLAMELSDVFQWSIDFFAIQKNDKATVIYDELYVDDECIGSGKIYGAIFTHSDKPYYAIRYSYEEKGKEIVGYWDETGKSLKSTFLKAPLSYSRISSKFSNSRLHPVLRIRRPHHGVDYAAPVGTPVYAIADGTVIARGYAGGNGNYIKLRHIRGYQSGYLHLSRFAKGLAVGKFVTQGEVIGYVGSTGISTGPHLDFRIWKNGTPIDPLKMGNEKGKDIDASLKPSFDIIRARVVAELKGEPIPSVDSLGVVQEEKPAISEQKPQQ